MDAGQSAQGADMGGEHCGGGACVVERGDACSPCPPARQRSLRAVYVLNDGLKAVMGSSPEAGALQCLQRACDAESALLATVTFGRLDFGETSVLDTFYDAGVTLGWVCVEGVWGVKWRVGACLVALEAPVGSCFVCLVHQVELFLGRVNQS